MAPLLQEQELHELEKAASVNAIRCQPNESFRQQQHMHIQFPHYCQCAKAHARQD